MISGEPLPVHKTEGDAVTGGTVNGAGALVFRATHVGAETTLSRIVAMVEQAQGAKLPIQSVVDRITAWFVPAVIAAALLTLAAWLVFGPGGGHAIVAAVAVLIIACPCAMGLAVPTSIMVGTGRAAELGVLFRKGDALQALQGVGVVALDKTGTVTEGRPELTDIVVTGDLSEDKVLRSAAAVEGQSEHPVAQALLRAAEAKGLELPAVEGFRSITGYGVEATVEGRKVTVGARRLMEREGIDTTAAVIEGAGKTPLYVAVDGTLAAAV